MRPFAPARFPDHRVPVHVGTDQRVLALGLVVLVSTLLSTGCAPLTPVRRTALIPTITPVARVGSPLYKGEVRIMAEASGFDYEPLSKEVDLTTEVGSAGVYIPNVEFGAAGYVGVSPHIELGIRMQYGHEYWSTPNTVGVLPFPESEPAELVIGGIGMRVNMPFEREKFRGAASLIGELNGAAIPQATYYCETCAGEPYDGEPLYTLHSRESEQFLLPNLAFQVGAYAGDIVFVDVFLGAAYSITNVGFESDAGAIDNSTLQMFLATYAGIGVEVHAGHFVTTFHYYLPYELQDDIVFGPLFSLQVGTQF